MTYDHHNKQLKVLFLTIFAILFVIVASLLIFWKNVCATEFSSCLTQGNLTVGKFFLMSFFRPFFFTPINIFAIIAGNSFGPYLGTFYAAMGGLSTCALIYYLGHLLGRRFLKPWLYANLPQTYRF